MTNKKASSENKVARAALMVGAVAMWAGFEFFKHLLNQLSGSGTRDLANVALRDAVIGAIADRLDLPSATVRRVLEEPERDRALFEKIRKAIARVEVTFQKPRENGEKPVPVVLKIYWDQRDSTLIAQDWPLALLPPEVRDLLGKQRSVMVEWELPDFESL